MRTWLLRLIGLDLLAASVGMAAALFIRFGSQPGSVKGISYVGLGAAMPLAWVASMSLAGSYQRRHLVAGAQEFQRVLNGAVWLLAAAASLAFLTQFDASRALVLISLPMITVLTLAFRYGARKALHRQVTAGKPIHRVLAVGRGTEVAALVRHMDRQPHVGFTVVAAWAPESDPVPEVNGQLIACANHDVGIAVAAGECGADTVAIADAGILRSVNLQELSWQLEGSGVSLVVAPAITDIAGPRIRVWPVDGLPLLHVDEPRFSGAHRLTKEVFDLAVASITLLLLSPLLLAISLAIKLTSRGPVLFRQQRVGLRGERITMLKFRTMFEGSEAQQGALQHLNESSGPLFKIRRDPRVTRAGRWLRRFSLDELPQLWNVLCGSMSLVGPRPPLASEVATYDPRVHRRLLVKPGITGLWQVSGRSDVSWEESVRLDLYYVEQWSIMLDVMLMWKTLGAVFRSRGAY